MADSGSEFTGKSVDEAIAEGLAKLGLTRNQVDVEILSRGSRGIFGLGSEPARVRITRHSAAPAEKTAPRPAQPPVPPTPKPVPPPVAPSTETSSDAPGSAPAGPPPAVVPPAAPRVPRIADMDAEDEALVENAAAQTTTAPAVSDEELEQMAVEMLSEMVRHMGFDAKVKAIWHEPDQPDGDRYLLLDIHGHDLSALIGRRGETLAGIQYLVRLMINQRLKSWKNIVVDVDHYKERRVAQLTQLAHRMAEQVAQSGRAVSLEPMPPNERRIVHLALRDHAAVYTQSSGEGDRRKVHIVAKN